VEDVMHTGLPRPRCLSGYVRSADLFKARAGSAFL
jgi:hypothetical protein